MATKKVIKVLEKAGVSYEIKECDCNFESSEHAAEIIGVDAGHIAKCLVYMLPIGIAVIIMAGNARIDRNKYKQKFKVDPIPLDAEDLMDYTGYESGAVSPIAITYKRAKVYMDYSLKIYEDEIIYPSGGTLNSAIGIKTSDLFRVCDCKEWIDIVK